MEKLFLNCVALISLMHLGVYAEEKKELPRVFITAIPKSGTHMLMQGVTLLTGKVPVVNVSPDESAFHELPENQFLMTHLVPSSEISAVIEQEKFKGIFIYRDPRDQLMSLVFWIDNYRKLWPELESIAIDDLIFKFIHGQQQPFIWFDWYKDYLPWLSNKNVYSTTYERLVGPKGGGNAAIQLQEINNIAKHIGFTISEKNAQILVDNLYGKTGTFREGKIGGWRKYFNQEHKIEFKKVAGQLLIDLGYEKDFNW